MAQGTANLTKPNHPSSIYAINLLTVNTTKRKQNFVSNHSCIIHSFIFIIVVSVTVFSV